MSGADAPKPGIPGRWLASKQTQAVLFVLTVLYCVSPIDLIPDVMPIVGWLDDLGVLLTDVVAFLMYLREKRRVQDENSSKVPSSGS